MAHFVTQHEIGEYSLVIFFGKFDSILSKIMSSSLERIICGRGVAFQFNHSSYCDILSSPNTPPPNTLSTLANYGNESENFEQIVGNNGLIFLHKHDRKPVNVDPKIESEYHTRHEIGVSGSGYIQATIWDHRVRK